MPAIVFFAVERKGVVQMKSRKSTVAVAVLMLAFGIIATSAQAKEGTWSGTYAAFGTSKATEIGKDRLLIVLDENGLSLSDNPLFDHTTWHCWGQGDFTNGTGQNRGYCVGTDLAGDQVVLDFVSERYKRGEKSVKGSLTLTGGTGKYAGITGSGTYVNDGPTFRATEKGTYFSHTTVHGSYKLP